VEKPDLTGLVFVQVDQIPNMVTSVAFGLGGDVITGDSSGRIFVWNKDNSEAFVVDAHASDNLRHAHEVRANVDVQQGSFTPHAALCVALRCRAAPYPV